MTQRQGEHDLETFQDVLVDHFTDHGIQIPGTLRKMILKRLFRPGDVLQTVCAVQYGKYVLLASQAEKPSVRAVLWLDVCKKRLDQFVSV